MFKQFCVIFNDGSGRTLIGTSKEDIRKKHKNVKDVFVMGIKHSKGKVIDAWISRYNKNDNNIFNTWIGGISWFYFSDSTGANNSRRSDILLC